METIPLKDAVIVKPVAEPTSTTTDTKAVAVPTTTAEEDRKTSGQRSINLIWEATQAVIAMSISGAVMYSELSGKHSEILGNAFTLIIAVYFVRMNHIKVGGIGGTDSR